MYHLYKTNHFTKKKKKNFGKMKDVKDKGSLYNLEHGTTKRIKIL